MAAVCFRWTQACVEGHIFHLCVDRDHGGLTVGAVGHAERESRPAERPDPRQHATIVRSRRRRGSPRGRTHSVAERLRQAAVGRGLRAGGHEGRRAMHQPRVVARPVEAEHARAAAGVQRGESGATLSRANGRAGPALGRQWFGEGARAVQTSAPVRGGGKRANLRPSSVVQARARAHSRVRLSAPRWRAEAAQPRGRHRPRAAQPPRRRPLRRAAPLGVARARREGAAQSGAPKVARARVGVHAAVAHAAVAVLHNHAVDAVCAPGAGCSAAGGGGSRRAAQAKRRTRSSGCARDAERDSARGSSLPPLPLALRRERGCVRPPLPALRARIVLIVAPVHRRQQAVAAQVLRVVKPVERAHLRV